MFELLVGVIGLAILGFLFKKGFDLVRFILRMILNPVSTVRNIYTFIYALVITVQRERSNFKNGVK